MLKIGFSGAHCSGKTTLARKLVEESTSKYGGVAYVSSVSRGCPIKTPVEDKQNWIITQRIQQEIELSQNVKLMVCERTVLDDYAYYCQALNSGKCKDGSFVNMQKHMVNRWLRTYDQIFLMEPLPIKDDGVRPVDRESQEEIHWLITQYLSENNFHYTLVPEMELEERYEYVLKHMKGGKYAK